MKQTEQGLQTERCLECNALLTDYEKNELGSYCGGCYNDYIKVKYPKHPDDNFDVYRGIQ